ncbi:unnamed protein product [Somion occarium]|uniref:Glycoside hydrolase family 79 protein n=1 Tax=Somion occarium TaxID=3059160 RepID=A0ABP1DMA1_9APHY
MHLITVVAIGLAMVSKTTAILIPSSPPSSAKPVDSSLLSVSIEFFTFPAYTQIQATTNCLANIATLRGAEPAIRIGGTTQDRATYNPTLSTAVNYTVASPADAPASLTYGPSFFSLASQMKGDVTVGLNRQLNNQAITLQAAQQAKQSIGNLFAIELGNEPEFYASNSPVIPSGQSWNQDTDAASEKSWFSTFSGSVGNIFQGAVYLSWNAGGLLSRIGSDGARFLKSISRHSYPQSACGGASTNLPSLMSHSGIVSYTRQYQSEATAVHAVGLKYFLGETNSATCGGGGISPTFGLCRIVDRRLCATGRPERRGQAVFSPRHHRQLRILFLGYLVNLHTVLWCRFCLRVPRYGWSQGGHARRWYQRYRRICCLFLFQCAAPNSSAKQQLLRWQWYTISD